MGFPLNQASLSFFFCWLMLLLSGPHSDIQRREIVSASSLSPQCPYLITKSWFVFVLATAQGLQDLSSPTRDWTHAPCSGSPEFSAIRTARDFPHQILSIPPFQSLSPPCIPFFPMLHPQGRPSSAPASSLATTSSLPVAASSDILHQGALSAIPAQKPSVTLPDHSTQHQLPSPRFKIYLPFFF